MLNVTNNTKTLDFRIDGSEDVYSIPFPAYLPVSYTQRLKALATEDRTDLASSFQDLFVEVLDRYAPGATDKLSWDAAAQIMKAWGDDMGES